MESIYSLLDTVEDDIMTIKEKKKNSCVLSFKGKDVRLEYSKNVLQIVPIEDDIDSLALSNIINKFHVVSCIDNIYDTIADTKKLVDNLYDYCVVCGDRLEFQSKKYITCGTEDCNYKYEELLIDNPVIDAIKDDSDIIKFLIESAFDAIKCNRKFDIFEPFPKYFLKSDIDVKRGNLSRLKGNNYDNLKNFTKLNSLISKFNIDKFINQATEIYDDKELMKEIGKDMYILIRFIIMSCKVRIRKDEDLSNNFDKKGTLVYKIIQPTDKEDDFKKLSNGKNELLFHGSASHNWYSILRNGLKNCSNTKLMTAGAAHGSGIYFSGTSSYSYSYGKKGKKNESVIGVFEVADDIKNHHKSGNIYVVKDEKVLIQRYILLVKSSNTCAKIDKLFRVTINKENREAKTRVYGKGLKKLVREYKRIKKSDPDILGFKVVPSKTDVYHWKVYIIGFDKKSPIGKDMVRYGYKHIELEVKFPGSYPFNPPFIRVISPRFKSLTGHVTRAGALCMQILTEPHWVSTCSIESLIITIKSEILGGGGRLDPDRHSEKYSESEAKASFIRVARGHGWL